MRWFLGGEVTEVYAAGTTFKHPEFAENGDTETGMAMLKFDNGTVAFLHVGRTAPHGYHTETEIVGTEAHIRVAGVPWKDRVMVYDQYGARQEIIENFPQRFAEAYLLRDGRFHRLHPEGRKPELTVYDGTKATLVTYAITDSFHTGKPVTVKTNALDSRGDAVPPGLPLRFRRNRRGYPPRPCTAGAARDTCPEAVE